MGATKTQILEELKKEGLDEETYQMVVAELQDFSEELSNDDLQKIDVLFAKIEQVEIIAAQAYGEMADALGKEAKHIYDAGDEYIEDVAQITYDNVKLAQDLAQ